MRDSDLVLTYERLETAGAFLRKHGQATQLRRHDDGDTSDEDGLHQLLPSPTTLLSDPVLGIQATPNTIPSNCSSFPSISLSCCARGVPARPSLNTVSSRGHLGRNTQGCAKKEDVALEEEAQADGWQGPERRYRAVQMPSVWGDQEDAPPLPQLPVK